MEWCGRRDAGMEGSDRGDMGVGVCLLICFFKQRKIWACSTVIIIFFGGL